MRRVVCGRLVCRPSARMEHRFTWFDAYEQGRLVLIMDEVEALHPKLFIEVREQSAHCCSSLGQRVGVIFCPQQRALAGACEGERGSLLAVSYA